MSQLVSYNENHFVFLFIVLKSLKQSQTSATAVELKVKETEWITSLTKHYCIIICMQKPFSQSAQFIKSFLRYT